MRTNRKLRLAPPTASRVEELEPIVIEWDVQPIGAQRVRELLGGEGSTNETAPDAGTWQLRQFVVRQVMPGRGVWLEERHAHGGPGAPIWIKDAEASEYLEAGNLFASPMRPDGRVTIPRFWHGCKHCAEQRRRRRAAR